MSNETRWTPGPWACHPSAFMADGDDKRAYFIVSGLGFSGKADANAHLIAAAPELYEELEKARRTIQALIDDGYTGYLEFRNSIDAALAKARGEQS